MHEDWVDWAIWSFGVLMWIAAFATAGVILHDIVRRVWLLADEREKQQSQQAQSRKLQVGSGDRSERIRTYNFPQGRVTDHRINLTLYKLDQVMNGSLDELIAALNQEHQAEELAQQVE